MRTLREILISQIFDDSTDTEKFDTDYKISLHNSLGSNKYMKVCSYKSYDR